MINILLYIADRKEVNDKELRNITKTDDLLDYLDKKYLVFNNIAFLQGLFLECKAPHLYDRCVEYAKSRGDEITYFETKILESGKWNFSKRTEINNNYFVKINIDYLLTTEQFIKFNKLKNNNRKRKSL